MINDSIKKIYDDGNVKVYMLDLRGHADEVSPRKVKELHEMAKDMLLSQVVLAGKDISEVRLNEYGKPYIPDSDIHFSLSHDEGITVLAVAAREIGIDIEKICDVKWPVINRLFPFEYKQKMENLREGNADEGLIRLEFMKDWTSIEAVLKARGTGFHEEGLLNGKSDENHNRWSFLDAYELHHISYLGCEDFVITFAFKH